MFTSHKVLDRHVRASNAIERITAKPGEPLYDQHLEAAKLVSETEAFVDPIELHQTLFEGIEGYDAGNYRTVPIFVGNTEMPAHDAVPELMSQWLYGVSCYISGTTPFEQATIRNIIILHDWFLCIHPFLDGNGRTARLIFNMLRKLKGMPWIIVRECHRDEYMIRIKAWEKYVFRKVLYVEESINK